MFKPVRICEACGHENDCNAVFCADCGQPIGHLLPTKTAPPPQKQESFSILDVQERICPKCGATPASHRMICECGERLFENTDSQVESKKPSNPSDRDAGLNNSESMVSSTGLFLSLQNRRVELKDGDILGREGTVAVSSFSIIPEVSRQHARILKIGTDWHLVGLSENITEVDGNPLQKGLPFALRGLHRVRLSSKCEIILEVNGL